MLLQRVVLRKRAVWTTSHVHWLLLAIVFFLLHRAFRSPLKPKQVDLWSIVENLVGGIVWQLLLVIRLLFLLVFFFVLRHTCQDTLRAITASHAMWAVLPNFSNLQLMARVWGSKLWLLQAALLLIAVIELRQGPDWMLLELLLLGGEVLEVPLGALKSTLTVYGGTSLEKLRVLWCCSACLMHWWLVLSLSTNELDSELTIWGVVCSAHWAIDIGLSHHDRRVIVGQY